MTSQTESHRRPGQVAATLGVLAGVSGLLSAAFTRAEQGFTWTFWLRLLIGLGFLFSGILQFVARQKKNQKSADSGGPTSL